MDANAELREIDRALASGAITEEDWYARNRQVLEAVYLASDNPQQQSGLGGDAAHWARRRHVLVEAIDRDGAFLDVGCANGLLMESLVDWAAARGFQLDPYGLDISNRLAALARRRLPHWAGQIFTGNVITWQPPRRFDVVYTCLEYVPNHRRPELVARLLNRAVAPGGRLVVCSYRPRGSVTAPPLGDSLQKWGWVVSGEATALDDQDGGVATRVFWLDAARNAGNR